VPLLENIWNTVPAALIPDDGPPGGSGAAVEVPGPIKAAEEYAPSFAPPVNACRMVRVAPGGGVIWKIVP
jgi:hypothetical protein